MEVTWVTYAQLLLQFVSALAAGFICLAGFRWASRLYSPLGVIVGLGLILRAWSSLGLFAISYLDLPFLSSLHSGDGFWHLALDARTYYDLSSAVGFGAVMPPGAPSPAFIGALAVWMRTVGSSPASAILLNLVLYVLICVLLIAAFRPLTDTIVRRAAVVTVSTFSFSPILVLLGTQPLKDVFFAALVVCATVGMFHLLLRIAPSVGRWGWSLPLTGVALAVFLISGVRVYYAVLIWGAALAGLVLRIVTLPRREAWMAVPRAIVSVVLLWCAFMWGAGDAYTDYMIRVSRMLPKSMSEALPITPSHSTESSTSSHAALTELETYRQGFVRSGGATNLADSAEASSLAPTAAVSLGLAALFVPITLLMRLSIVDMSGGRGFLLVTDADTLFVILTIAAITWVIWSAREGWRDMVPFLAFAVPLAVVCSLLLGYVVTNYGTLFRLRILAMFPIWMLPLAVPYWHAARVAKSDQTHARTSADRSRGASLTVSRGDAARRAPVTRNVGSFATSGTSLLTARVPREGLRSTS